MISRSEFDYIKVALEGALLRGARIGAGGGKELAVVDPEAVLGALEACWESLVPPAYREEGE